MDAPQSSRHLKVTLRAWPEAGFDATPRPRTSPALQARILRLLFWIMLAPLLAAYVLEPSFKIGSTIVGVLAVSFLIRRDLRRRKAQSPP